MKVQVISNNGALYEGASYAEVIRMMKLDSFTVPATKGEYMAETAKRCAIFNGKEIEYGTPKEFLQELKRVGAIRDLVVK